MKIQIDHNHLVSISHPDIPQLKEYTYFASGWKFSDWDKGMVVLHKKDFKVVNLKNLGDGMQVIWVKKEKIWLWDFELDYFKQAFALFGGFDEDTGVKYGFLPGFAHKQIESFNKNLTALETGISCQIDPIKWVIVSNISSYTLDLSLEYILNLLFGLFLIYGKWEIKKDECMGLKIQIPLFGQYLRYEEDFDAMIGVLQSAGIFVKTDTLETNNWVIYQMSTTDYELLEVFAKWYESIEKIEKISKSSFTQEMKAKLLAFLANDKQIPENGKTEVISALQDWVIKFLTKQ